MGFEKLIISTEFIDNLKEPVFFKERGENGFFLYCNQAFLDFFGLPKELVINHQASHFLPKNLVEFLEETDNALINFADTNNPEGSQLISNKTSITLRKSLFYDIDRNVEVFVGVMETDTTHPQKDVNCKGIANLSKRESEVLAHLIEGKPVKTIAGLLNLSRHTVTDHIKSIYLKLGVHSKTEAACKAFTHPTI